MATVDLTKYGITGTTDIVYNPSYELLFDEETKKFIILGYASNKYKFQIINENFL